MAQSLTVGRPWRVILVFTVPLLIGNVVQQIYHVVDAIVVGRYLGVDSLAAVGATASLMFLLMGFAWGLTAGFVIPTAQAYGARDIAAVRRSLATGTLLTAVTSVILSVAAPLLSGPMLAALQTPPELMTEATVFAQVSFLGSGAVMFFNYLSAVIRSIGDSRTPLVFLILACLLNVGLVMLMVWVLGWGVGGAALATLIAQAVSVLLCLEFVRRRVPVLHLRREDWRVRREDLAEHLRLGLPMGFQASIIAIGSLAIQLRLNELGSDAVAAFTVALRIDGLPVAFLASLGIAVSMFVAQNHGGVRPDRIRRGVVQSTWISITGSLVLGGLLIIFAESLSGMFVGDASADVVDMATLMLRINGVSYSLLGVLFVLRGALQGLGATVIPTVTGIIELFMRVGAAVVLGGLIGFAGIALGNTLAWAGAAMVLVVAYVLAHRRLGLEPVAPTEPIPRAAMRPATASIPILGPADGELLADGIVPRTDPHTGAVRTVRPRVRWRQR